MGSFEVRFLEAALSDLEEITIYIATENKEAVKELHALIITRAKELSTLIGDRKYLTKKSPRWAFAIFRSENILYFTKRRRTQYSFTGYLTAGAIIRGCFNQCMKNDGSDRNILGIKANAPISLMETLSSPRCMEAVFLPQQ